MIETERLILRRARPSDLEPLHRIFSNPRAMRYWDRPAHADIDQTLPFLEQFMAKDADPEAEREEYFLELNGQLIGKAGCWKKAEVGYILHPNHWRKGYASEALRAIIPRAFAKFRDVDRLTAELDPRNFASARLLERLGFAHVGFEEKNFLYGEDEWCDTAYYELLREPEALNAP